MMRSVLFAMIVLASMQASAQRLPPSGQKSYGSGTFTISCLQYGQVVMQMPRVWSVEETWNRSERSIAYRMPDGAPGDFNYNSQNMTCRVEFWGQESVPVAARIEEERVRKEEERQRWETHHRLLRRAK